MIYDVFNFLKSYLSQSLFQDGKELVLESDASVCGYFLLKKLIFSTSKP
jgi:hypothetical protein